jgi:hypothetical protein
VKCDETRPQCNKCVRSGRDCAGFPASRKPGEVTVPILPRPQSQSLSSSSQSTSPASTTSTSSPPTSRAALVRRAPAPPIQSRRRPTPPPTPHVNQAIIKVTPSIFEPDAFAFDTQEGQYFQLFRTHTASELSGFFDSEFWMRSVLQESHSQASIRHAVIALGALYKTLEKASESPPGTPSENFDTAPTHYNFAVQQYAKAVTRLREAIQNDETRSHRTILISNMDLPYLRRDAKIPDNPFCINRKMSSRMNWYKYSLDLPFRPNHTIWPFTSHIHM